MGTPSNIHGTAISYRCAKFGAFVNSVTILTLRDLTIPGRNGGDGAKGEKGKAGPRGPRGFKGQAGEKGVAGTRGPRGIKGEAGLVGKVAAEQRNWKQCAWQKNDGRDIGLIK